METRVLLVVWMAFVSLGAQALGAETVYFVDRFAGEVLTRLDSDGTADPLGPIGFEVGVLALSPTGALVGVDDDDRLIALDRTTGAGTLVGTLGLPASVEALDLGFDDLGGLWALTRDAASASALWRVDLASGAASPATALADAVSVIAWRDGALWGAVVDRLVLIDSVTGAVTPMRVLPPGNVIDGAGATFDRDGRFVYFRSFNFAPPPIEMVAFDLDSGDSELLFGVSALTPISGLAALAPRGAASIPTLGGVGITLLVALLGGAAMRVLRGHEPRIRARGGRYSQR